MDIIKSNHYLYELKQLGDERGGLVVLSKNEELPFDVKRFFYVYNTKKNAIRGNHSNIRSSFLMISVKGSCEVVIDDSIEKYEYILDSPTKALFVGKGLWKVMKNFSDDNVLLIFSDHNYDEHEYVKDYQEYIKKF